MIPRYLIEDKLILDKNIDKTKQIIPNMLSTILDNQYDKIGQNIYGTKIKSNF